MDGGWEAYTTRLRQHHDEKGTRLASVAELADEDALRRLAGPIGYLQGVDLAASGCVQPARSVGDLVFQHVELRSTGTGLSWSCTCRDGESRAPCKHSVAVAVEPGSAPRPRDAERQGRREAVAQRIATEPMTASPTRPHGRQSVPGEPPRQPGHVPAGRPGCAVAIRRAGSPEARPAPGRDPAAVPSPWPASPR